MFTLNVRVYGLEQHSRSSHGYLIGDMPSGVSHVVGTLNINIRTVTLKQVRPMLEFDRSGHMDKRSLLFQEAMFIMSRLPDHSQSAGTGTGTGNSLQGDKFAYRLGFVKKDKSALRLVEEAAEGQVIADLIGAVDFFDFDLAIVPLTQIAPAAASQSHV